MRDSPAALDPIIPERRTIGAILAGGLASRFGAAKCLARFDDTTLIERVLAAQIEAFGEVVIVTRDAEMYRSLGRRIVTDIVPRCGPLGGLHAAIRHAVSEGADGISCSPCDAAFPEPDFLRLLASTAAGAGAVIPRSTGPLGFEPLFGWYSTATLPVIEECIARGIHALHQVIAEIPAVRFLTSAEIGAFADPDGIFFNVNTADDLARARRRIRKKE